MERYLLLFLVLGLVVALGFGGFVYFTVSRDTRRIGRSVAAEAEHQRSRAFFDS